MVINIPYPELVDVNKLEVDGQNPNQMTPKQLERLQKSIQQYGFIVPIITNKDLLIADGEQRLTAAKTLGMTQVMVVRLPVTDVDRRLLRQVLNKLRGEHDLVQDAYEFERIINMGHETELKQLLDLSDSQLERYLQEIRNPKDEDFEVPEIDKIQTDIKRGDIYALGNHRLMCGDSTQQSDVSVLMNGDKADMVFTDPPYFIGYLPEKKLKNLGKLKGHDKPEIIEQTMPLLMESCRTGACVYICMNWQHMGRVINAFTSRSGHPALTLVWDRETPNLRGYPQDYLPVCEFILYGWKEGTNRINPRNGSIQTQIWRIKTHKAVEMQHPTQKPVELSKNAILNSSYNPDVVLDLFGGSGSTLIACEQTGRRCRMMEIDERYCQVIIDRWENYTGQKTQKLN